MHTNRLASAGALAALAFSSMVAMPSHEGDRKGRSERSGSQPVPGGGKRERERHMRQAAKIAARHASAAA